MKIPVQTVISQSTILKLEKLIFGNLGDIQKFKFLGEFMDFMVSSNLLLLGTELNFKELENNFILRHLVTNGYSGNNAIQFLRSSDDEISKIADISNKYLMNVVIGEGNWSESFFKNWLQLKDLPEAWEIITNNRKTTFIVGGKHSIFKSWYDFGLRNFPVKSIVVIDPYLFNDADEIWANLPLIIEGLIDIHKNSQNTNILLIVGGDVNKRFDSSTFISKRMELFRSIIDEKYKINTLQISVAYIKGEFLHDRFIFSNYYFMDAGSGFNLYSGKETFNSNKPNKVTLKFLSSPYAYAEFEEAVKSYCAVLFNPRALLKLDGSLIGNEISELARK